MNILNIFKSNTKTGTATAAVCTTPPAPAQPVPLNDLSFKPFRSFELKIKAKSLAAEIRMIHQEEIRLKDARRKAVNFPDTRKHYRDSFWSLRFHREDLKPLVRDTNLAYGFLMGKTYAQIEPVRYSDPNWSEIERMILKYGKGNSAETLKDAFEDWQAEAPGCEDERDRQERKRLQAGARKAKKVAA